MKQYLKQLAVSAALVLGLVPVLAAPVGAINVFDACSGANKNATVCKEKDDSINPLLRDIMRTLFFAVSAIAVIMIIIGGIRYTLSDGDSSKIKSAKDTVLYSVIGLIVSLLAYTIVTFVTGQFG